MIVQLTPYIQYVQLKYYFLNHSFTQWKHLPEDQYTAGSSASGIISPNSCLQKTNIPR